MWGRAVWPPHVKEAFALQQESFPVRYGPNAILVAGMARASASTPIAVKYDLLLLVMILDRENGVVLDAECNMLLDVSSEYIASLLVGRCFYTDLDEMIAAVQRSYHGLSQKALVVCLKDAFSKMHERSPVPLPRGK